MKTADRVQDTSSTTGTGNFTLSGTPPTQYQAFGSRFDVGNSFHYAIIQGGGSGLWEVGIATLLTATTFSRDVVLDGSSGPGTNVTFSGATTVFNDLPAAFVNNTYGTLIGYSNNWMLI